MMLLQIMLLLTLIYSTLRFSVGIFLEDPQLVSVMAATVITSLILITYSL